ncbi:MAG TPA: hypothetical protein VNO21_01065 [Polyangiaceae bacterium]|nr:hypothetical protein [Polyangiaceae bacterium]
MGSASSDRNPSSFVARPLAWAMVVTLAGSAACHKSEPPPDPKLAAFQEVNRNLDSQNRIVAKDDLSHAVASRVDRLLTTAGGLKPEELKLAVTSGMVEQHRRVVVLARVDRLKNEPGPKRKALLEEIAESASQELGEEDEIIVGLREAVFYSAIGQGMAHGDLDEQVGATLDTTPLQDAIFQMRK